MRGQCLENNMPGTIAGVQDSQAVTLLTDPTPRKASKAAMMEQSRSAFDHEIPELQQFRTEQSCESERPLSIPTSKTQNNPVVPQALHIGKRDDLRGLEILAKQKSPSSEAQSKLDLSEDRNEPKESE